MKNPLRTIEERFRDISLQAKIFYIVVTSIVLICLFFALGFGLYSKASTEALYNSIAGNLSFSSYSIATSLKNTEKMSDAILADSIIQKALIEVDGGATDSAHYTQINNQLFSYYNAYRDNGVAFASITNEQFTNSTDLYALKTRDPELLDTALEKGNKAEGAVAWTFGDGAKGELYQARQIREYESMRFYPLGTILIGIDLDALLNTVNSSIQNFEHGSYIIYDNGQPIYTTPGLSPEIVTQALTIPLNDYKIIRADGALYFAAATTIPGYGWRYTSLVPYESIGSSLTFTRIIVGVVSLLGLLFALLLSRRLIRSITHHFNVLIQKMNRFSEDPQVPEEMDNTYSERSDEIGHLHQRFDWMAQRIATLINVNYKNELLTKEAQIKALEAQINPHFLYNTLESINWRAKAQNNKEISQMAEALGLLLRETLRNQESLVTLDYELKLVQSYMTIQKIRYEDRLDFSIDKDEALTDIRLPPLTIQPLLENAIRYGMEESLEPCKICVVVRQTTEENLIEVMNEGSQFEAELLENLKHKKAQPQGFGIGLLNIEQRLKLLFGEEAGLRLENRDGFAVATITISRDIAEEAEHETLNR